MGRPNYARKTDANQQSIMDALRKVGCAVEHIQGRAGVPDLLCSFRGRTFLIEVKLPLGVKGGSSGRALNDDQEKWHQTWQGTVLIVRSAEEAVKTVLDLWRAA